MRVVRSQAALLSDWEVLQLLRESEERHKLQTSERRQRVLAGDSASGRGGVASDEDSGEGVPPNVRTIQFEVRHVAARHLTAKTISSLSQPARPCAHQSAERIHAFLDALEKKGFSISDERILVGEAGLTRAERLQIVNHAPANVLDLHTVRAACVLLTYNSSWRS